MPDRVASGSRARCVSSLRADAMKTSPCQLQGSSGLQPASICNPPCIKCKIASGVRTWNCAGRGLASKCVPEAPE
eukprot:15437542-Alexandrium_andersonii.AAC.1